MPLGLLDSWHDMRFDKSCTLKHTVGEKKNILSGTLPSILGKIHKCHMEGSLGVNQVIAVCRGRIGIVTYVLGLVQRWFSVSQQIPTILGVVA